MTLGCRIVAIQFALLLGCRGEAVEPEASASPKPVTLGPESVARVERRRLSSGPRVAGTLQPEERAMIRAQAEGTVVSLEAELGARVRRGDLLLSIEAQPLRDALRSAETGARVAEQSLALAERQLARTERLAKAGALSAYDLELQQNAAATAEAQLADAKARLAAAREQLQNASVRSPLSGVVSEQPVHAGDIVAPGTHLLTVMDPRSMRLEASVPSDDLPRLKVGTPVQFSVRGYPEQKFEGRISRVAPAADERSRQVPILVSIPNRSEALLAGLFADGRILTRAVEGLALPFSAVELEARAPKALVVREGELNAVDVQLGVRDEVSEFVEIASGLNEGELVVIGEARTTPAGTPVTISGSALAPPGSGAPPPATSR